MAVENGLACLARKRKTAGQQLIAEHTNSVDIRSMIHIRWIGYLLWRHVRRSAESGAGGANLRSLVRARGVGRFCIWLQQRLGYTKIGDQRMTPREKHIVRFD